MMAKEASQSIWTIPVMWLIIGLPLAAVFAGIGLLVTAIRVGSADVVTDEVSRISQIQMADLSPDTTAKQMNLNLLVRLKDDGSILVLPVTGELPRNAPLRLLLIHPMYAKNDLRLVLQPDTQGWYSDSVIPRDHDWNLQLSPADGKWRVHGRLKKEEQSARLGPLMSAG